MGLDLVVEGCARPGDETEWRSLVERAFGNETLTEAELERFAEICIPAYERVGAPRVGYESAANDWILEARNASTPEEAEATLKEFHGYYALPLAKSEGLPAYTHGGLYEGLDETSFRGAVLGSCVDVLSDELMEQAWANKLPEAAVAYGKTLLHAAEMAESRTEPTRRRGFLALLGIGRKSSEPMEEQLKIVRAAGRWFVFWGERGHPIRAWF